MPLDEQRINSRSAPRASRYEFKRAFLRGLGVLLPSVLTLWILVAAYQFVDRNIAEPINGLARAALAWGSTVPGPLRGRFEPAPADIERVLADESNRARPATLASVEDLLRAEAVAAWWHSQWWTSFFGIAVALLAVYTAGRLVGGWLGRRAFALIENGLTRLPVLKQVYPAIKQIVGFFFADTSDRPLRFSRVVLVEYPRRGIWSIGLLTGQAMRAVEEHSGDSLTVFVPSSPTPFTGYTINVPKSEVHELPISIDEALKYVVSGGVVTPPRQVQPEEPEPTLPPIVGRVLAET